MKTFALFVAAIVLLVASVRFVQIADQTVNLVVVPNAVYDGRVGRWERMPDGQFVFTDDMGPYIVLDEIPGR